MKILHVTKKYPEALGGDAVVVHNLRKQQEAAGHTVVIVTSNCPEITEDRSVYKVGLNVTPAGLDRITFRRIISLAILSLKMFPILYKERPTIIHTHSVDMAFSVSLAAWLYDIPMIHTFHIVTFYDKNQSWLRRKSEIWLAKKARLNVITAPNEYDVQKLYRKGLDQAQLLPNGVDINFWGAKKRAASNRDEVIFVSVGRLEEQKGYEYLLKAAALLNAAEQKNFKIMIIGEGSLEERLHQLAKSLNIENIVTFAGRKTANEIRDIFVSADIAVFPALYETTPLTLLEAWAAGLPAIATSVGILRDVSDGFDAAYIAPPKDEHALVAAMQRAMIDALNRDTVARNGKKEVQKYEWSAISRLAEFAYVRAYED